MTRANQTGRAEIRKGPDKNTVSAAVRQLREELGETQQQFALRMQTAIRTIARYETIRPPKGKVLRQLEVLALEARQLELAGIFRMALAEEMGISLNALRIRVCRITDDFRSRYHRKRRGI